MYLKNNFTDFTEVKTRIDEDTGEVLSQTVITADQRRARRANFEKKQLKDAENEETKQIRKRYGIFVWLLYNTNQVLDWGIKDEDIAKLIFISTYMNYDNRLMSSPDRVMNDRSMRELLKVSDRTFERFIKSITDANILFIDNKGCYCLNEELFLRGKLENKDYDHSVSIMKLYANGIRKLYQNAKIYDHRLLAYLFRAIPFVNINYNMLCHNPEQSVLKLIKPMLFSEFCKKIGYSIDNERRLKNKLKKLRIDGSPVFNFVENDDGRFCYINPYVYYGGNQHSKVMVLGEFEKK